MKLQKKRFNTEEGVCLKYSDVAEAIRDYKRLINEGFILMEDRKYFENKYNIEGSEDEEEIINKVFGAFI